MRKLWIAVLLAAMVVAVLPMQASANHTLRHRVSKLENRVNALQSKVNCLRRAGASLYFGFAGYNDDGTVYTPLTDPVNQTDSNFAAIFDQIFNERTSDYWLSTVNKSRSCARKFGIVRSPYSARVATRAAAMTRLNRLSRVQ